jgi:hypothetical protein
VVRPIDEKQVDKLVDAFETTGLQAFDQQAHLLLIVPVSSIANLKMLWQALKDTEAPPVVQFTPGTKALAAAGGQHRLAALEKYIAKKEAKVAVLERKVTTDPDYPHLHEELRETKMQLEATRWWGVQIYDEGESPVARPRFVTMTRIRQEKHSKKMQPSRHIFHGTGRSPPMTRLLKSSSVPSSGPLTSTCVRRISRQRG